MKTVEENSPGLDKYENQQFMDIYEKLKKYVETENPSSLAQKKKVNFLFDIKDQNNQQIVKIPSF